MNSLDFFKYSSKTKTYPYKIELTFVKMQFLKRKKKWWVEAIPLSIYFAVAIDIFWVNVGNCAVAPVHPQTNSVIIVEHKIRIDGNCDQSPQESFHSYGTSKCMRKLLRKRYKICDFTLIGEGSTRKGPFFDTSNYLLQFSIRISTFAKKTQRNHVNSRQNPMKNRNVKYLYLFFLDF